MLIDCYGNPSTSVEYFKRKKHFAESAKNGAYTYIRFSTESKCAIHRIDETDASSPKVRWAYGTWAGRTSLAYVNDLNTPLEITGV